LIFDFLELFLTLSDFLKELLKFSKKYFFKDLGELSRNFTSKI
jgi:hypothetical protein